MAAQEGKIIVLTEKQKALISAQIQKILSEQEDQIRDNLLNGINGPVDNPYVFASAIATNAIKISTKMSVQILLEYLESQGVVSVATDERTLTKLSLSVVSGGKDNPPSN